MPDGNWRKQPQLERRREGKKLNNNLLPGGGGRRVPNFFNKEAHSKKSGSLRKKGKLVATQAVAEKAGLTAPMHRHPAHGKGEKTGGLHKKKKK